MITVKVIFDRESVRPEFIRMPDSETVDSFRRRLVPYPSMLELVDRDGDSWHIPTHLIRLLIVGHGVKP